jgi:DNA-binding phage protein
MRQKTGFDRWVDKQMKEPSFAAGYAKERAVIAEIDALVQQLDKARVDLGLTKGELARRAQKLPAYVRRLLLAKGSNPTLRSTVELARHLGLRLKLVPIQTGRRTLRTLAAKRASPGHGATGRGTRERKRSPKARTHK